MPKPAERIRGRLVELEIGEVADVGWVAVGVVREGLAHEVGMTFRATAEDPRAAESRLRAEIESFFA